MNTEIIYCSVLTRDYEILKAKIWLESVMRRNPVNGPAMLEQIEAEALGLA